VEVSEPHPHKLALEKAKYYKNLSYQKQKTEAFRLPFFYLKLEKIIDRI
jgi:hypothetical protein